MSVHYPAGPIVHPGETASNELRRCAAAAEPAALRTYTPSLAVIARSEGCYHWTPEGRKLADFTSGVLVANLGHNSAHWWRRVLEYLGLSDLQRTGEYVSAAPLTSYNAGDATRGHGQRATARLAAKSARRRATAAGFVGGQR